MSDQHFWPDIRIYTATSQGTTWLQRYQGCRPILVCVLGFTATGLIPQISAAGATPEARQYTAIADAEFLYNGSQPSPRYPLPPLIAGASPVFISRAVIAHQTIPLYLFNAGLPIPPAVPTIDLQGSPAQCLSTGHALSIQQVHHLFEQGRQWGHQLAQTLGQSYAIVSECVVGGTTTALAVLMGLGIDAAGKVNSSHPTCNHNQKLDLVKTGLAQLRSRSQYQPDPAQVVAGVGDPMQPVVAGFALAASETAGVLLAGGTQMLAIYALASAWAQAYQLTWNPENVIVGTTRWVAEDPTGDTVGLAHIVGKVPLLATQLNMRHSRYPQLRAYEAGFVKEGVGAGGCAIAAHLYHTWNQAQLLAAIEHLIDEHYPNAPKGLPE